LSANQKGYVMPDLYAEVVRMFVIELHNPATIVVMVRRDITENN